MYNLDQLSEEKLKDVILEKQMQILISGLLKNTPAAMALMAST